MYISLLNTRLYVKIPFIICLMALLVVEIIIMYDSFKSSHKDLTDIAEVMQYVAKTRVLNPILSIE